MKLNGYDDLGPLDSIYWADNYGENPVMDERARIAMGVRHDNVFPVCARKPDRPDKIQLADEFLEKQKAATAGNRIPYCPDQLFERETDPDGANVEKWLFKSVDGPSNVPIPLDLERWAARGAINAGLAVFLYLQELKKGAKPTPLFDQCEQLK